MAESKGGNHQTEFDALVLRTVSIRSLRAIEGIAPVNLAADILAGIDEQADARARHGHGLGTHVVGRRRARAGGLNIIPAESEIGKWRQGNQGVVVLVQEERQAKLERGNHAVVAQGLVLEITAHTGNTAQLDLLEREQRAVGDLAVQARDDQIIRTAETPDILCLPEPVDEMAIGRPVVDR
jgi:hypothetical protein